MSYEKGAGRSRSKAHARWAHPRTRGPHESVAIIGAGPTGLMHAMLALHRGCRRLLILQRSQTLLDLVREVMPSGTFISTLNEGPLQRVLEETDGIGADVVIVAAPSKEAQQLALEIVGRRGRVSFFGGLPHGDPVASLNSNTSTTKECLVPGASSSTSQQNQKALALLGSGAVRGRDLVTHMYSLGHIEEALETARDKVGLKVVARP